MTDQNIPMLLCAILAAIGVATVIKFHTAFVVNEGFKGLLYRKGRFVELLPPGRHVRWGLRLALNLCDVRRAILTVAGQEVLTADNAAVKVSLLITYQIVDPEKALHQTQVWYSDIHTAGQLAARTVIGGIKLEALLAQRGELSAKLLALVQPVGAKIGSMSRLPRSAMSCWPPTSSAPTAIR